MSVNSLNLQEVDQEQALSLCKFFIKSEKNIFFLEGEGSAKLISQSKQPKNVILKLITLI